MADRRIPVKLEIEHLDENISAITFTDSNANETTFLFEPSTLTVFFPQLLELASRWAKHSDLSPQNFSGDQKSLPAQRIELGIGRDGRECAVRIWVGDVQLTFLVPLDEILAAVNELATLIKPVQ